MFPVTRMPPTTNRDARKNDSDVYEAIVLRSLSAHGLLWIVRCTEAKISSSDALAISPPFPPLPRAMVTSDFFGTERESAPGPWLVCALVTNSSVSSNNESVSSTTPKP